jgi:hypothetical protein
MAEVRLCGSGDVRVVVSCLGNTWRWQRDSGGR